MAMKKDNDVVVNSGSKECVEVPVEETVVTEVKEAPDGGYGWVVCFTTFVLTFILTGFLKSFGALRPAILKEFPSSDPSDASWISTLIGTLSLVLSPIAGVLTTNFGFRAVIVSGGALCAFGSALSYFATSIHFLIGSLGVLIGIGASFTISPSVVCLGKYFVEFKPMAVSFALSGGCIGGLMMPSCIGALISAIGLHYTFLVMALFLSIICVCGLAYGPPSDNFRVVEKEVPLSETLPKEAEEEPGYAVVKFLRQLWRSLAIQLFADPRFVLTVAATFVVSLGGNFLPFLPQQAKIVGANATSIAMLATYVGIGQFVARVVYGVIASGSPFSRSLEFTIGVFVCAVVALLIPVATAYGHLIVLAVTGGLSSGIVAVLIPLVLTANHGKENLSGSLNLVRLFQGLAKIIYPAVARTFRTEYGTSAAMLFVGTIMCAGAVFGLTLYLVTLVVAKKEKQTESQTSSTV